MPSTIEKQSVPEFAESELKLARVRAARVPARDDRATPEAIPPERLRLASANIRYLSAIIRQLVELRSEEESDEYGALRASEPAFDAACHLLTDAAILSAFENRQIPYGCASTDSEGGVRIEWVRPAVSVHLVVPATANRDGYIYHEAASSFATEPATPEVLARWLRKID